MNDIFNFDLTNKKGILVIGSARSGTHFLCDILDQSLQITNKVRLFEMYLDQTFELDILRPIQQLKIDYSDKFIITSITQPTARTLLSGHLNCLKEFYVIDLRRRNKIAQFISYTLNRSTGKYNPELHHYEHLLPISVDTNDLIRFISEQNINYAIQADKILYYEDIIKLNFNSKFRKNHYPVDGKDIFLDFELVNKLLGTYQYHE